MNQPIITLPLYITWLEIQESDAVVCRQGSPTQSPFAVYAGILGCTGAVVIERIPLLTIEEIRTHQLNLAPFRLYWDPRQVYDYATLRYNVENADESAMDLDPPCCALHSAFLAYPRGIPGPSLPHPPLDIRADTMLMLARRIMADPPTLYTYP